MTICDDLDSAASELSEAAEEVLKKETIKNELEKMGIKTELEETVIKEANKETTKEQNLINAMVTRTKPKESVKQALEELKKGNINGAADSVILMDQGKATTLLKGNELQAYKDVSIGEILQLRGKDGISTKVINQMAKERSEFAMKELAASSEEMKRIMFRANEGEKLTTNELSTLWKEENRELAMDALWHEKAETNLPAMIQDDIEERLAKATSSEEKEAILKENELFGKQLDEEIEKCAKVGNVCGV
jgi:hypothetical protein